MNVFPLLQLLVLVAGSPSPAADTAPVSVTRICYGLLRTPQADCDTRSEWEPPAPARLGQGVAIVAPHFIAFDVVDDSSVNRDLDLQRLRRIPFSASISEPERATSVSFTVREAAARSVAKWTISLTPDELAAANAIMLPDGRYDIEFSAPHYRTATAVIDASAEKAERATIVMRRIPTISGRILSWTGVPAFDASVQPLPGKHGCAANSSGEFICEAGEEWPAVIRIEYPGAGTKVVQVGPAARNVRLGDIRLQHASMLKLFIGAPPATRAVSASIFYDGDGSSVEMTTHSVTFPASEPTILSGLEPGDYRLMIRGERPLQQYARSIRITDSETVEKVLIHESQLTLNVVSGTQREPGASVTLKSIAGKWRGNLVVDNKGSANEPLWQTGEFSYALRAKGTATPLLGHGSLDDDESLQWTLALPAATIEGKVLDDGGNAVPNAAVGLMTDDGEMQTSIRTTSDAAGHFVFEHVRKGSQTLTATADNYLPGDPVVFALSETETGHAAELRLTRGTSIRVSVVDRNGVPYPRAIVFEAVDNVVVNTLETDASGDVEVKMPDHGAVVLIAVPASGSFALRRIGAADREARTVRVSVVNGSATLEIKSEQADHTPVRDVHFLVRQDGETIPFEVLMRLAQWHMLDFKTGADGLCSIANLPPGMYELWPYATMSDVDALMSGMDLPAPLRVTLGEGVTTATMTFRKKSH